MRPAAIAACALLAGACASVDRKPVSPSAGGRAGAATALAELAELRSMNEAALAARAANEESPAEVRDMASFLHVQAVDRRRLRESAAAAERNLREERKATESQKVRADALQERAAQLQHKLDALGEIERSLSDRQSKAR